MKSRSYLARHILLGVCLVPGSDAFSQTVRTWVGTSPGQFLTGSNWTPSGVPSGAESRVRIDNGAAANADVVLSGDDATIGGLGVTFGDQLRISSGTTLTLQRAGFTMPVDNAGTIAVGAGHLQLAGDVALNGFGTLTLAGGQIKATTAPAPGGVHFDVLTNRSDIKGYGTVVPAVENGELIQANTAGQTLSLLTVVDNVSGILEASSGGTLSIGKSSDILNSSGMIRANAGSTVAFLGSIHGGSLHNNGGTLKSVGRDVTQLDGVTITGGKIQILPDPTLSGVAAGNEFYFKGTITNRGELACEGTHPTAVSHLGFVGPVQFQGGGSLKLNQGGPGTGGPAALMRYNFSVENPAVPEEPFLEKIINGLTPPPPPPTNPPTPPKPPPDPTLAQQHTIEGAGRIEVEVLNQRGGTIRNPATATGPLVLENLVTNLGTITSAKALTFQGVNGFTVDNEPEGKVIITGGTFGLNSTVLANKGEVKLTGNTEGTATGSIVNTGTLEVSGNSSLTFTSFSPSSTPLQNNGTLKILGAATVNLNAKFEQSPNGTLEIGFNSAADFGRINALAGDSVSTLAGKLKAVLADDFTPAIGTQFQIFTGACQGHFTGSSLVPLPGNADAALQIIYEPYPGVDGLPIPNLHSAVLVRVVPAEIRNLSSSETVDGLVDGVAHYVAASNGAIVDINPGNSNSLGLSLSAEVASCIRMKLAQLAEVNTGSATFHGKISLDVPPSATFRIQSDGTVPDFAQLNLKGKVGGAIRIDGGQFIYKEAATRDIFHNGYVSSKISEQYQSVENYLNPGGEAFDSLRKQVEAAILGVLPQELDPDRVIQTTRIIALGGGNIVANGGGNLTLIPGGNFSVSEIHLMLRKPGFDLIGDLANKLASGNSHFNAAVLLPAVSSIVAMGGAHFDPLVLNRVSRIVANGGGNFSTTLDLVQTVSLTALETRNQIVANGGGNLITIPLAQMLPQISNSLNMVFTNSVVANGEMNLTVLNDSKHTFENIGLAPRGAVRPRNEILNRLVVAGDYTQSKAGFTQLLILGSNRYDQVVVEGKALLDGGIGVLFSDPDVLAATFAPANGSSFDVMIASEFTITQGFKLMLPILATGQVWSHQFVDLGNGTGALRLSVNDINAAPEITVEGPGGAAIAAGGSQSFGTVEPGNLASISFTIRNTGSANLTGLKTFIDGTDALEFSVSTEPSAPVSGGNNTTFTVDFFPFTDGAKTAVLHIASNDADRNPYDIILTGTGGTAAVQNYTDWAAAAGLTGGNAQPLAAPHGDGVPNWLKYAFGMNGSAADQRIYDPLTGTPGLPNISYSINGTEIHLQVIFQRRIGSAQTYTPKTSDSLAADSWIPIPGPTGFTPVSMEWEQVSYDIVLDAASAPVGFAVVEVSQ